MLGWTKPGIDMVWSFNGEMDYWSLISGIYMGWLCWSHRRMFGVLARIERHSDVMHNRY